MRQMVFVSFFEKEHKILNLKLKCENFLLPLQFEIKIFHK